jgi:NADH dehydrogenase
MKGKDPVAEAGPRVVVVGMGFGGLEAAKALKGAPVRLVLVDRRNHHLFQPLLYQVATATLTAADIAAPIRHILKKQANAEVILGEVVQVDLAGKRVRLGDGSDLAYDFLLLAPGSSHSYFGKDEWAPLAPGLKSLEDALEIRRRFLLTFERAERERDPEVRRALLTYVVVGGGPTGVEMAGTLKEIARKTLPGEYRNIRTEKARVILVEAGPRILPSFGEGLSDQAKESLERIGVEVRLGRSVTAVDAQGVNLGEERIPARTVLWAAGVAASPLGRTLDAPLDRTGRVFVEPDLSLAGHPEVFVVGDMACFQHGLERPLPGVAPVAIQQGRLAARNILASLRGAPRGRFRYRDRGSMATIGRGTAVAMLGGLHFSGLLAWLAWLFVHLMLLVGFQNRLVVFLEWCGAYLTTQLRARLILDRCQGRDHPLS